MAVWTEKSSTGYDPSRAHLFREETRKWYIWINRAGPTSDMSVRVYPTLADAQALNSEYVAYGTVSSPTTVRHTVSLTNNASKPPTFTDATIVVTMDSVGEYGSNIWECDLGSRLARTVLRVHRGFSAISIANGYFIDVDTCELGMKQWEDAKTDGALPYIGVGGGFLAAEPGEVGDFALETEFRLQCVAHLDNDPLDPKLLHLYDDLRKALRAVETTYDGTVNDGMIYDEALIVGADKSLGLPFASDHGTIEFDVLCRVFESGSEITGS